MAGTNYNSPFIANGTTCRDEDTPLVSNESADDGTGKLSLISALKSFTDFEVLQYQISNIIHTFVHTIQKIRFFLLL